MRMMPALTLRIGAAIVAAAMVAGAAGVFWVGRDRTVEASAYFDRTVGLYPESDVRVLGVKIGEVQRVVPQGSTVRVDFSYDADRKVPAGAKAAILAPSVVSDRYVQLAPVYTDGPVLQDGATIPVSRTAVPVEVDQIFASLNDLTTALGPDGANRNGELSELLAVSADNLEGQGDNLNATLENLSDAATTLSQGREDLFGTVRNLQEFTTALAEADQQVKSFNENLAAVSTQLDGEREELAAALRNLSVALQQVTDFVRANRDEIRSNVEDLTTVTGVLVREQERLARILDTAPLALSDLAHAYNPTSATLDTRMHAQQTQNPVMYLCSLLYSAGMPPSECEPLLAPLGLLAQEHNSEHGIDLSPLTAATTTNHRVKDPPPGAYGDGGGGSANGGDSSGPDPTLGGVLPGGSRR